MEEIIKLDMTVNEAEQLRAIIDEVLVALQNTLERTAKDQAEIDRLRTQTREIMQRDWRGGVDVEAILPIPALNPSW